MEQLDLMPDAQLTPTLQSLAVKKVKSDPFMAGIAAAVASVVRQHDEPAIAADVLAGYGLTLDQFKGIDLFDLDIIKELYRTEFVLRQPA